MTDEIYFLNKVIEKLSEHGTVEFISGVGRSKMLKVNNKRILVKYSKERHNRYFFGAHINFLRTFNKTNDFILFVCGNINKILVIPANYFFKMFDGVEPAQKDDNLKINVHSTGIIFKIKPTKKYPFDVTTYLNNYSQIFDKKIKTIQKEKTTAVCAEDIIDRIKNTDPDFFKKTTQEQIYDLKYIQLKLVKLLEGHVE